MVKASTRNKAQMAVAKKRMAKLRAVRLQYVLGVLRSGTGGDGFVDGLLQFEIDQAMDQYRVQRFRAFNLRRASPARA